MIANNWKSFVAVTVSLVIWFSNISNNVFAQNSCDPILAGQWHVKEIADERECGDPIITSDYYVTVTINDCDVTVVGPCGTSTGQIVGNIMNLTGTCPEDGGVSRENIIGFVISPTQVDGTGTWDWSDGYFSCSGTSIYTVNLVPESTKTVPSDGSTYTTGKDIQFSGSGTDYEDGTLSGNSLTWTSDLDGLIGTGENLPPINNLSVGTHNITFAVTDNGKVGASIISPDTVSKSFSVTVKAATPASIFGTVTNAVDSTNIAGAKIAVATTSPIDYTDSLPSGAYYMGVSPGIYTITCSHPDYSNVSFSGKNISTDTPFDISMFPVGTTSHIPDIKANGSDIPVTLGTSETLLVNVSLVAGGNLGVDSDWWVAASTPFGWYYFDVGIMNWKYAGGSYTALSITHQGALFDLDPFEVMNMSGLPVGTYTFYFIVDTNMNGLLESLDLFSDSVVVDITP